MDESVFIRTIAKKDIAAVAGIEKKIFPKPWTVEVFRDLLSNNPASDGLVLEYNDTIIGYAIYWIVGVELHIANIAVEKEYRRRNFGGRLLEQMLKKGREAEVDYALLEVRVSNIPAIRMYEKYSFKGIKVKKSYYNDNKEDALIMVKSFGEYNGMV